MAEIKGILAVIGTAIIYFSIGLYFSSGNTAIYLTSYLRAKSTSTATLSDSVWFLYAVGLSALLLPFGGWLDSKIGSRAVCIIGGLLQSGGIFATYFALNHSFILVLICYGGSFLLSCGVAYTAPLVEINKWFPEKKGLVTGIACASMAFAPTAWTPLITAYVNPLNIPADMKGYFTDTLVLERTKDSLIFQGLVTLFLFSIGTALLFPAPSAEDLDSVKKQQKASGNGETGKVVKLRFADGLTPSQAIKTFEFIILSIKIMLTELVFFYLLFVYKPFGQTFIKNDLMLSAIGACAGLSNCFCRLLMGYIKDILSYKACCIPLSAMSTVLIASLPFSSMAHPIVYSITVVAAVGIIGSQYALMPSAVTDTFGEKYASMNIGLVYMSTVIADVGGALGSQYLTESLGWTGMIYAISFCSFLDFIATFALPSDPGQRLKDKLNADKIVTEILPAYQMNRNKGVKGSIPIVLPEAYLMRKESNPTKTSLIGKQLNC